MNGMPKVVVSGTLTDPTWNNTTVLQGDVVAGVTELKGHEGGPVLVAGSKTLVHALLDNDLVDELRLMVFPVTIGSGLRVFPETTKKTAWRLTDSRTFPSQVRVDTYHRALSSPPMPTGLSAVHHRRETVDEPPRFVVGRHGWSKLAWRSSPT